MPEISVVIPLWNKELYIKNTIESVINQTYKDSEILVINDGSAAGGADVVNSLLQTAKPTGDEMMIDTLREGLSRISSRDIKKDVLNLIGKYYKYYSIAYLKSDDGENAVRCIRESIRYMRGRFIVKPVVLRIILLFPGKVWKVLPYVRTLLNKI